MGRRIDLCLNDTGRQQAQELARMLEDGFPVIYTSPLRRAKETAEIVAGHLRIPVIPRPELAERDFGSLAGVTWPEAAEASGLADLEERDFALEYDYRPYGGECADEVTARFLALVEGIQPKREHDKILLSTHGGIIRVAYYLLTGSKAGKLANASTHEFEL